MDYNQINQNYHYRGEYVPVAVAFAAASVGFGNSSPNDLFFQLAQLGLGGMALLYGFKDYYASRDYLKKL